MARGFPWKLPKLTPIFDTLRERINSICVLPAKDPGPCTKALGRNFTAKTFIKIFRKVHESFIENFNLSEISETFNKVSSQFWESRGFLNRILTVSHRDQALFRPKRMRKSGFRAKFFFFFCKIKTMNLFSNFYPFLKSLCQHFLIQNILFLSHLQD